MGILLPPLVPEAIPTKDDEIAALKAMLKRAEARAKKAKSRAERAEKKLQDKEELIERYDILLPILLKEVRLCREQVLKLKSEFPEIQADIWQELVKNLLSDFENIPQYRQLARLFSKGSEKAGRPVSPQKLRNELDAEGKAALCGIITRSQKMKQALTLVDAGGKAVSDIKTPVVEQDERRPSPGRKAVEKFRNAPVASTEIPAVCPDYGSADYEVSDVRNQQLREIQVKLNDSIEHLLLEQRNGRCSHCGHVHHYLPADQDLPVAPGRTIGQRTGICQDTTKDFFEIALR